jgi:hypothetical protein
MFTMLQLEKRGCVMDSLLEQVLDKLRIILQDANEIDTYIINDKREEMQLKAVRIRNNANDIKEIFNILKDSE